MKVRSITLFSPTFPQTRAALEPLAALGRAMRAALEGAGFVVQTVRLATPPWPTALATPAEARRAAIWLDQLAPELGLDYLSIGPVLATEHTPLAHIEAIPELLAATERLFCTVLYAGLPHGLNVAAARATARVIEANARIEANGFGNLRFAALANVGPGSPFFPAAYAEPGAGLACALALESADLAVQAYKGATSLAGAMAALRAALEEAARALVAAAAPVAEAQGARFLGLDFSLAPFPDAAHSAAGAIESLGAAPFGAMGTLAAAALTTQALQEAAYPRCGFSGLMLPVLEDSVLAARAGEGSYDLHSLLLYSAVCGTGLDTVPLPGDTDADTLAALLLDVAALALRLDKPLTARLMPVPGKAAGETTTFDFPFFANSAILAPRAPQGGALLAEAPLPLRPRTQG